MAGSVLQSAAHCVYGTLHTRVPVDALTVSKLAANEARIAAIKAQLAKPADDVQARLARLLAELRASRPQAPTGKLAVTYPDGRVAYIPDPAVRGAGIGQPFLTHRCRVPSRGGRMARGKDEDEWHSLKS